MKPSFGMLVVDPARRFRSNFRGIVALIAALLLPSAAFGANSNPLLAGGPGALPKRPVGSVAPAAPRAPHLTYFGGRVVSNMQVVQVLWGTGGVGSSNGQFLAGVRNTSTPSMATFYQQSLNSAYVDWLTEYNTDIIDAGGHEGTNQIIGRGSFSTQVAITPTDKSNPIDDSAISTELVNQIMAGHVPMPTTDAAGNNNTYYAIFFPHGLVISLGGSKSCVSGGFCAYHGTIVANSPVGEIYYGVHPDMQTGSGCETGCGSGATLFDDYTGVASHEMIETITDCEVGLATNNAPPLAWYDTTNGEIGDICNGLDGTIVGADAVTYGVQKEFSNTTGACIIIPSPTPTPTATATRTATPTATRTATATATRTATPTASATLTATATASRTATATATTTSTATATATRTATATATPTPTPTSTATKTATATPTASASATSTSTATATATVTASATATATSTGSPTFTATPSPTPTSTASNTTTATQTATACATATTTGTATATGTASATASNTATATRTASATASGTATSTGSPTSTATPTPTPTSTATETATPTATASPGPGLGRITVSPRALKLKTINKAPVDGAVVVGNSGTGPLHVTVTMVEPRHKPFSTNDNAFTVEPSASSTVTVTFAPGRKGTTTGDVLKIKSDDPTHPKAIKVTLTGVSK